MGGSHFAFLIFFSLACRRSLPLKPYTAYVVNHASGTLAAVNLADFHVTASLPVSPQPDRVLVRPDARLLYVVSGAGKISVVAFPRLRLVTTLDVGRSAKDLAFSPDGRAAYVLDPADHEVDFLDCGAAGLTSDKVVPKVVFRLRLGGTLSDLTLSPDGETLVADSAKSQPDYFYRHAGTPATGDGRSGGRAWPHGDPAGQFQIVRRGYG